MRLNIHHHTNVDFFFTLVRRMCSLPRSRFVDVTQQKRCVTSKKTAARETIACED